MKGLCAAGSTCAGKSLPKSARWTGRPNLLALIDDSLLLGVVKVINKLLVDRVAWTGFDRRCKMLPTPTGGAVVVAGSVALLAGGTALEHQSWVAGARLFTFCAFLKDRVVALLFFGCFRVVLELWF